MSGEVATKEHGELALAMDMIDLMPPGLYEAVISSVDKSIENPELVQGSYLFSLETRALDDIRALGGNTPAHDLAFATTARISEINQGLYRTLAGPVVRAGVNEQSAEFLRHTHPNRLRFEMFSDRIAAWAEMVRDNRRPVSGTNPLLAAEHMVSEWIAHGLKAWGELRDTTVEAIFWSTYASPWLQAAVGLGADGTTASRRIERDLEREMAARQMAAHLEQHVDKGGLVEAAVRALIYIRLPEGKVDERSFAAIKEVAHHCRPPSALASNGSRRLSGINT